MKKIQIMETVLRDGHQSLMATRMSTKDMLPALDALNHAGYAALEMWGGATFDSCLRYLDEDPWQRLRTIREKTPNVKLQMLLRGQNLLGYRHYADDVVDEFIRLSIKNGMDIIRVFDALNDVRNLETSIRSIKQYGGHCQAAICYTISPVHTLEYYRTLTEHLLAKDVDSLAIKDMAGILTPKVAADLVGMIRQMTDKPIEVHTHATSGVGAMTYLESIKAGADIIDTAISPFAGGTSQPATESMTIALEEYGYQTGLDRADLSTLATYFRGVKDHYRKEGLINPKVMDVAPEALIAQVPGGMLSNLMKQLQDAHKEDLYDAVLAEVPNVRADMGYPPLVTPLSQMVGTQAVMNVISGQRYKLIPKEIKDYFRGLYGQSPAPVNPEVQKLAIGDEDVFTGRPADQLQPELPKLRQTYESLDLSDEELLSVALFPTLALPFIRKLRDPYADQPIPEIFVSTGI